MTALRIYDPSECDENGVPLDWERCQTCDGRCWRPIEGADAPIGARRPCDVCGGHGSLKAAALADAGYRAAMRRMSPRVETIAEWLAHAEYRCEGCGHLMSDGLWENPFVRKGTDSTGRDVDVHVLDDESVRTLLNQPYGTFARWAERTYGAAQWSPCDEECRHGAPVRTPVPGGYWTNLTVIAPEGAGWKVAQGEHVEASWRAVDVRRMGWPHDLRPGRLKLLCLRCWAEEPRA